MNRRITKRVSLLLSTSLFIFVGALDSAALAKSLSHTGNVNKNSRPNPPDTRPVQAAAAPEKIVVHSAHMNTPNGVSNTTPGGGLMATQTDPKSKATVTRDFIAKQNPSSTPQSLIALLPGVAYARTDPYGLTSRNLIVRGLNQSEVGYLVDGVSLNDRVYYDTDSVGSAPDAENMQSVTLSQGSSDITSPAFNAAGAQIDTKTRDPSHKAGGMLESSYGSWNMKKEFVRLESGDIGHTGIRAFASYSYNYMQFWDTPGSLHRNHVDAKLIKEWGQGNSAGLNVIYGEYESNGITGNGARTPTKQEFEQDGTSSLYYSPTYTMGNANYYMLDQLKNKSLTIYAPIKLHLAHNLDMSITPYYMDWDKWTNFGEDISENNSYVGTQPAGPLNLPYAVNGKVATEVVDPIHEHTYSLMANLAWHTRHNTFRFGAQYEFMNMHEDSHYTRVGPNGIAYSPWSQGAGITTQNGITLSGWEIGYKQQMESIYFDDTVSLLNDRLKITAGFKEVMISRTAVNNIPGIPDARNGGNYAEPLPQASISYNITKHDQIYINGMTSFKAPDRSEAYLDMWDANANQAVLNHTANMKPEYAIGEEIGFRHNGLFHIAAALFNYNITNHDVMSQGYTSGTLVTVPMEVGGQTIRGAQIEFGLRPWHHFSPYLSGSYVNARTDNNISDDGTYLPTKGKQSVNTPAFTGSVGLSYDDGRFFGNFALNYIGRRYTTFMNDESIPGYLMADITAGYRMKTMHINKFSLYRPQFQLNFMNLGNNVYYGQASSISMAAHNTVGLNGKVVPGSSPQYNIGGGFAMSGTITVGF